MKPMPILSVLSVVLLASACSGAGREIPQQNALPTDTPVTTPVDAVEAGERLFRANGCATCHGEDGQGTGIGPALPGHTAEQVRRQVRSPIGNMPRFGPEQISDDELEQIAAYIESLEGNGGHMEPHSLGEDQRIAMHHWMAMEAIKAGNVPEADHHIEHIRDLVHDHD